MEGDRAHVVASGFLALLASQIGTRILTFTINLLIARHLSPDAYGLASVQFHLLTTTALFISREGFRRGCLRFGAETAAEGGGRGRGGGEAGGGSGDGGDGDRGGGSPPGTGGGAGRHIAGSTKNPESTSSDIPDGGGGGGSGGGVSDRSVLRVAALTVPLGLAVTVSVCGIALWRHSVAAAAAAATTASDAPAAAGAPDPEVPYYREAVILHGVAAVLELLGEPFYILASVHLMFGPRVAIEFASNLVKSLVTLGLLSPAARRLLPPLPPALLFSAAQLAMAAVVLAGYWGLGLRLMAAERRRGGDRGGQEQREEQLQRRQGPGGKNGAPEGRGGAAVVQGDAPGGTTSNGSASSDSGSGSRPRGWLAPWTPLELQVLGTSAIFTLQAVEKLALAEGSKVVLATLQSAVNQGVYGLVSNLGSLVVRTLFQPLEEAAFAAFSTWGAVTDAKPLQPTSSSSSPLSPSSPTADATGNTTAASAPPQQQQQRLTSLARALSPMVKAVSVLGLLAAAFGPSYSYVLLRLVYGKRWSETEAPEVLAAYSVYVLLLALNGIGEAFVHAVLDARGLQQSNALLLVFSGAHLACCVALVRQYGALGLVAADSANMVLRIAYSAWCIRRFFLPLGSAFSLRRDLLPAPATLAAFIVAAAVAAASNQLFMLAAGPAGGAVSALPQGLFLRRAAAHVAVGVVLLVGLMGLMARTERGALRQVLEMRRRRRAASDGDGDVRPGVKGGKED